MKRNKTYCYICGKEGADTKDHIPPRGIFPYKPKGQLITVKAHRTCNEGFQEDDELFRNLIIAASYRTSVGKNAWDNQVVNSFGKNPGAMKILNDLLIPIKIEDPISGKSFNVEGLRVDAKLVERQVLRWTKGFYFKKFREPLSSDSNIEVIKLQPPEISITPLMQRFANAKISPKWNNVEKNVFSYSFITNNEAKDIGFIIYVFFDTEVYLATINVKDKSKSKYLNKE